MPVNLSVKNVPDEIVRHLKARAAGNHRSLQGEILAVLEESVKPRRLNAGDLRERVRALGLISTDDSTAIVRELRDGR
jgi:plasmid stability protein